jgi:hypothetical protein
VAAELEMGVVRGDVQLRAVAGAVSLEEAQGDLRGHNLAGGLTAHQVLGSVSLKTPLSPGAVYRAKAEGDISVRFPPETSARLALHAQEDVSVKGLELEEQEPGHYVGQVGEGEAEVSLEAGGSISVKVRGAEDEQTWGFSMEELGAQIEAEISAHMGELEHGQIAAREIEKVMRQVEHEIEKAQRQAEKAAERAQERARKAQEKALKRAKRFQARVDVDWQPHGRGRTRRPRPSRRVPSTEEQARVLSMLQAGTISVQDAEKLLQALGG